MTARIEETHIVYDGWTTVEVATIRFEDGFVIHREVENHGTAVAVLAFDAERGVALLTSQCRAPILREGGDRVLEVPAGLEEGEDSATCARREVLEETGVRLDRLANVVRAWTMPGLSTERCSLFLAEYREADRIEDGGGLAEDGERITVHELPLATLAVMADEGKLTDLKTFALLQTLRLRRPELFAPR